MTNYAEFDASLISHIRSGKTEAMALEIHLREQAKAIDPGPNWWRVIDRRLQALRKRGLIEYTRKTGWRAKAQEHTDKPQTAH